ncbi:Rv3235 family protein [Georgenia sunbinii]|uniref:Rv3235 family protein n=1 Tax=Georgenia sunbinii TaxID=3117728 RepID=UPI002F264BBD
MTTLAPAPPSTTWDPLSFRAAVTDVEDIDPAPPDMLAALPAPGPWAGALVRAAVEVLTGSRPPAQLARWLSLDLYESIVRRAGLAVRILGRPQPARVAQLRRVHCHTVRPGVHEVAVVVHDGVRVRAAAVRIEAWRGRWRATALEIG